VEHSFASQNMFLSFFCSQSVDLKYRKLDVHPDLTSCSVTHLDSMAKHKTRAVLQNVFIELQQF